MKFAVIPAGRVAVRTSDGLVGIVGVVFVTLIVTVSPEPAGEKDTGVVETPTDTVGGRSGDTKVERSKKLNSSSFSCGVIAPARHSAGKCVAGEVESFSTWYSVNNTRPHCWAEGAPTGVLKVNCMTVG